MRGIRILTDASIVTEKTDDKPRGAAEFTQTIPKYRANESRVKLAWLCRV